MATNHVNSGYGVPRSYSMPAFRVVGFQPSRKKLSSMVTVEVNPNVDGIDSPRVSSPLSRLLIAEKNGSTMNRCGDSFSDATSEGSTRMESMESSLGSLDGGILNTMESMSSDGAQATESNLEGYEQVVAPAAPIDIPYNAHGVRHWKRQAQYRQQRRAENWA